MIRCGNCARNEGGYCPLVGGRISVKERIRTVLFGCFRWWKR